MTGGKLNPAELKKNVLSLIAPPRRKETLLGAGAGGDCGILKIDKTIALSSDPITGAVNNAGTLAVHISCNDAAAAGAEPVAVLLTLLAPPGAPPGIFAGVIRDAETAAAALNIDIIGGHTEYTDAVNRLVAVSTVIGKVYGKPVYAGGGKAGDEIIMTKSAATEAAAIYAYDRADALTALTKEELTAARDLLNEISVVPESRVACPLNIHAMHDATEGGIIGAVNEMAAAAGLSAKIYEKNIPVKDITAKICGIMKINPLYALSSGSLLIAAPRGEKVADTLRRNGIPAAVIAELE